jgi:hypothetical protein
VDSIAGSLITVLGITVDTGTLAIADDDSEDGGGTFTTPGQLLDTLSAGDVVKLEGTWNGSTVTWQQIELEQND